MNPNLHLWLIPVLALAGAAINGLLGRRFSRPAVAAVGLLFPGAAFAWALRVAFGFSSLPAVPYTELGAHWIRAGSFSADFALYLDQLSLVMLLVVTGVGFLIHVYSVGYMWEEGGFYRYFSYLNLFMFFMLTLVLANNYLLMFVGWEGVGLASYLLIGFFFLRDSAANAGKKAFIVNRIGDSGFMIALFLLIQHFGSLNFEQLFPAISQLPNETGGAGLLTAVGILLMIGACGKSAQLPLYVWLPDAMEGPTPVSALIHAATMVTAGVYMVARSHVVFDHAPMALTVVAIIGILTALFAATIGMAQTDIKKVLAYSTISQLGYMFLACGVAAYSAGIFHLMTHAFFKGLLFLAAGSVIHAVSGEQDLRKMGGLLHRIPWTFWTMTMATFAISGVPFFSGFFSKDEILWKVYSQGNWVFWLLGILTALLTSFYMFRLWFMTFFGEYRGPSTADRAAPVSPGGHRHGDIHESPTVMLVPLVLLAVLSVVGGYLGVPEALGGTNRFEKFLAPVFHADSTSPGAEGVGLEATQLTHGSSRDQERVLTTISVVAASMGFFLAWLLYYQRRDLPGKITQQLGGFYQAVANKYWVDELYGVLFVKPLLEGSSRWLWRGMDQGMIDTAIDDAADSTRDVSDAVRHMQSGNLRSYAGWVAGGAALVIAYMIWMGTR